MAGSGGWQFGLFCTKMDGTVTVLQVASGKEWGIIASRMQCSSTWGVPLLGFLPSTALESKGKSFWGKCKEKVSLTRQFRDSFCLSLFSCNLQPDLASFFLSLFTSSFFRSCLGLSDESLPSFLKGLNHGIVLVALFPSLLDVYIY